MTVQHKDLDMEQQPSSHYTSGLDEYDTDTPLTY